MYVPFRLQTKSLSGRKELQVKTAMQIFMGGLFLGLGSNNPLFAIGANVYLNLPAESFQEAEHPVHTIA